MAGRRVALSLAATLVAGLAVQACGPVVPASGAGQSANGGGAVGAPPSVTAAKPAGMGLQVEGEAAPGASVRLATPTGEAQIVTADNQGRWKMSVALAPAGGMFGLSTTVGGEVVQGEGYLYLTPKGDAVMLRAGAGAVRIAPKRLVGVLAVDFDREGSTVVSGKAPAGQALSIWADGRRMAEGRADAEGRFSLPLNAPLAGGSHDLKAFGEDIDVRRTVTLSPPTAPTAGPYRHFGLADADRIDWITPGGGVQSTLLFH